MNQNESEPSKTLETVSPSAKVQRWSSPDCPFAIDYSGEVMNRIRQRSVEAFHTLPHGGLEIGGLLFGRVMPNARNPIRVEIAAERPIECAHAAGPSFILSEEEIEGVSALLERTRLDAEIAALSVVGYWVSHSRTNIGLSLDDQEVYKRLFPYPWQIVLVIKPEASASTRAAFFFRANGRVQPHAATHLFTAGGTASPDQQAVAVESERYQPVTPERRSGLLDVPAPATRELDLPGFSMKEPRRVSVWSAFLLMLVSAVAGAAATYYMRDYWQPSTTLKGHDPELNLEIFATGSELLIHWNSKAVEIQNATRGELIIQEGSTVRALPLSLDSLSQGFLRHTPLRGDVRVNLKVFGQNGAIEQASAHFSAGRAALTSN